MNDAKLKAAGLWEKTSASGNRYFVGRLGGVRILIFENRDRKGDDEPTHHLYFAEAGEKPRRAADHGAGAAASTAAGGQRAGSRGSGRRWRRSQPSAPAADSGPPLDDPLPPWLAG